MATKAAYKRLTKEYVTMQKEPPPFIWAAPDEKDILTCAFRGPPDSPYAGGEYHGVLLFPSEYPFKPPGIKMYTPSGRFQPDKRICFSMSDFHPGSWNPAWSVATILTGLVSFMLSDEMTTGSMTTSDADKRALAARSHSWNVEQRRFKEAFPEYCTPIPRDPPNMGEKERGIPDVPNPTTTMPVTNGTATVPPSVPSARKLTGIASATAASKPIPGVVRPRKPVATAARNPAAATGGVTAAGGGGLEAGGASGPSTIAAGWRQLVWEKWRWGVVIALAVILSKMLST
ncbi:ubiquitin-conjugating enzyme/RWD-like protein [Vararia minispora EC-137]|uniref:Ubiquitin-conjugating enzyme/RWD-like protein n=1 Tax=Vararia minispora EC-137 TaxID=1314806 RepID=A0ACB8QIN0_9AGAM|nr:ubiquitin-conjugating enzyme/RWD-like protein [Vararia minispora EC-137]